MFVSPPADAERGDYRVMLDLGLTDPVRADRSAHWQRVTLRFQVWTQPEEPYVTSFDVSEDAESVTPKLSAGSHHHSTNVMTPPSFHVTFVGPYGEEIDAERVGVTTTGSVNLGTDRPETATGDSTYSAGGEQHTFRYRIQHPENGTWAARIMPDNAMRFNYELVREES